jgi:tungstate transport system ATP-binding protein
MTRTAIYEVSDLRHAYDGRTVLEVERLAVRAGEILALVGPSGAGKSTLLRLLNFLERPTSGSLVFDGRPVNGTVPLAVRREVTTVFQRPLLQRFPVRANVAYGLRLRGLPADGRVDEMLARVGLASLARRSARTLSGGEMQRVALARALVIRPRVLLLDEPTANLDPYHVDLIEGLVREVHAREGTTVVLVTHNIFQARRLADRTGLLLGGRLVELAETAAFFGSPADPRTAAFVRGEMVY